MAGGLYDQHAEKNQLLSSKLTFLMASYLYQHIQGNKIEV